MDIATLIRERLSTVSVAFFLMQATVAVWLLGFGAVAASSDQHTALVSGIWWWIAFPVASVVVLFIGLFLLAISMNEYIDPRSRLARLGNTG